MKPLVFIISALLLVTITSCRKHEEKADIYPMHVRYEAFCDTCSIRYFVTTVEHNHDIVGTWNYSFTISNATYLHMQLNGIDSAETAWVKIFLNDALYLSSSTAAPGVNGQVLATGYSPLP